MPAIAGKVGLGVYSLGTSKEGSNLQLIEGSGLLPNYQRPWYNQEDPPYFRWGLQAKEGTRAH